MAKRRIHPSGRLKYECDSCGGDCGDLDHFHTVPALPHEQEENGGFYQVDLCGACLKGWLSQAVYGRGIDDAFSDDTMARITWFDDQVTFE